MVPDVLVSENFDWPQTTSSNNKWWFANGRNSKKNSALTIWSSHLYLLCAMSWYHYRRSIHSFLLIWHIHYIRLKCKSQTNWTDIHSMDKIMANWFYFIELTSSIVEFYCMLRWFDIGGYGILAIQTGPCSIYLTQINLRPFWIANSQL